MTIRLAEPEARALEGFCRRQLRWDAGLAARIVTPPRAMGVFTAPPLGVLAFVAVPTLPGEPDSAAADVTVSLAALADALPGAVSAGLDLDGLSPAGVQPVTSPSVRHLPPTEGWQLPMFAVAGDLGTMVDEATAEFESRSPGLSERARAEVAEEIWDRKAWAGLPMRALHAARQLGMLAKDRSRVSAATCGPWKRFSTQRGQVFSYDSGPSARLALHVVR